MSEPFDWAQAGKAAQDASIAKAAERKAADELRARSAVEEKTRNQLLLNRSWAVAGELNKASAEIATEYNRHIQCYDLRFNLLGGGVGGFTLTKGTRGVPRLEFLLEGVDKLETNHATSGRSTIGSTEVYTVKPEGDLLLIKGAQLFTPIQVAEPACKWLAAAQSAD